jgi:hypothetical protein
LVWPSWRAVHQSTHRQLEQGETRLRKGEQEALESIVVELERAARMAPEGLTYLSSVVSADGARCYQLMECDDPRLLDEWMAAWNDLVAFEVVPVISSAEATVRFGR